MSDATIPVPEIGTRSAAVDIHSMASVFHALSDPKRLHILQLLASGERCVCDLQDDLALAQSLLSFHLKTLRDAGLVRVRRSGRWAHYSLAPAAFAEVDRALATLQTPTSPAPLICCGTVRAPAEPKGTW